MANRYEVRTDWDNGIVFGADTVDYEARIRQVTPLIAARRLAKENADILRTGEKLIVHKVKGE